MSRRPPPPRAMRTPWASIAQTSRSSPGDHQDEERIGSEIDASPGSEIEDSSAASRLGELSGYILAAIATGLPGTGAVVAAGPLAAELGEVAGHVAGQVAGDLKSTLIKTGMSETDAEAWRAQIEGGRAILIGMHARSGRAAEIEGLLARRSLGRVVRTAVGRLRNEKRRTKNEAKNEERNETSKKDLRMAVEVETGRFTVGVFQDIAWAEKGIDALRKQGLAVESLSIIGKASPEMAAFIERQLGSSQSFEVHDLGPAMARGPLVAALQGSDQGLTKAGIAGTMRRVGFQPHDGRIFHVLTGRGGVLVAIHSEPRAADALAVLHSYGGGNAAIGAWTGRV